MNKDRLVEIKTFISSCTESFVVVRHLNDNDFVTLRDYEDRNKRLALSLPEWDQLKASGHIQFNGGESWKLT